MVRALIDIPGDKLEELDEFAAAQHVSRASLVRVAIDEFLKKT